MHPLVAIAVVFLAGMAWVGTIVTLLIALAKARRSGDAARTVQAPKALSRRG